MGEGIQHDAEDRQMRRIRGEWVQTMEKDRWSGITRVGVGVGVGEGRRRLWCRHHYMGDPGTKAEQMLFIGV
jgi:hypothetical protein